MAGPNKHDLQAVLAALRGYTPSPAQVDTGPAQTVARPEGGDAYSTNSLKPNPGPGASLIPGLGLLPPEAASLRSSKPITPPPVARHQAPPNPHSVPTPQPPVARSKTSTPLPTVPDASTIVTWPAALKHVTKHLVPNEQVAARIKHLISEQHKHERQWWAGREAIVAKHEGRDGASQQVSALLRSLGGKDVPIAPSDPKAMETELKVYDEKVYKGLLAMAADFDRQLRALGIPFYAIKHELVILEEGREKEGAQKGRIDRGELRELQKRMLQTLEDLFGD